MRLFSLLLALCLSYPLFAYEELEPRPIQDTVGSSFALPFYVSSSGEISFLKNNSGDVFSFSPVVNGGFNYRSAHYVLPERTRNFALTQSLLGERWLEVYTREISVGVGLATLIKSTFRLGFVPYKGAKQRYVRNSDSPVMKKMPVNLLPSTLKQIEKWSVGDRGTFERFGGVEIFASLGINIIDVSASILFQNAFILEIARISQDEVSLAVIEKSDQNRKISSGVPVLTGSIGQVSGKVLNAEFILNLRRPEHHELYESALAGNLSQLQEKLPYSSQKTSWTGQIKSFTLGLAIALGKNYRSGRLEIEEKKTNSVLVFHSQKDKGFILPHRDVHRLIYFNPRQMVLFWSSELQKVKGALLEKRFLQIGRRIGIEGFDFEVDPHVKIGSVMTQLGVTLTQNELGRLKEDQRGELDQAYSERCTLFKLDCRKEKVRSKNLALLFASLKKPWDEGREVIGKLLVKNPTLIHSLVKTLKLKKKSYFYLLSDTVKSMEGMAPIIE